MNYIMVLQIVLIISFGIQFMLHLTRPSLTLFASELGASMMEIGLLTSMYAFFPLLFAISAGKIADRIGDRLPILLGLIAVSAGLGLPYLYQSMWSLYASQMIVGLGHIFILVSVQNVLGHAATRETRDHYFGLFTTVTAMSQFIAPVLGGYIAEYTTYAFPFLIAAVIGCIPVIAAFRVPVILGQREAVPAQSDTGSLQLLKNPILRKAMVGSALVLYSRDIFIAYFPLYASRIDISDSSIGWIVALQSLAMVPVRFYLSKLSQGLGRERLLVWSILIAGAAFLCIPLTSNVLILMLLSIVMGAGLGVGQPLSMTTIYNASPKSKTGEVLGLRLAINRGTQLGAPFLFGAVGSAAGLISVFVVSGVLLVGGALYTRAKPDEMNQTDA